MKFGQRHVGDSKVNWKKVLGSDKTLIELFGHQTRCYVRQRPNTAHHHKHTISTVKHGGGKIMLWGCFSAAGPGRLVKVEGNMNAGQYHQILEGNLTQSARELRPGKIVFYSKTTTPSIWQKLHRNVSKTTRCSGVAKSKPRSQSNREFVAGLEKSCSLPIPEQHD